MDLESLAREYPVLRTPGEYRLGIAATILVPCAVGLAGGVADGLEAHVPVIEACSIGAIVAAGGLMGGYGARGAKEYLRDRGKNAIVRTAGSAGVGVWFAALYGGFAFVAQQLGYWSGRLLVRIPRSDALLEWTASLQSIVETSPFS